MTSAVADAFRAGMRRLAGTVTIVSAMTDAGPRGMTATAVMSVSADPPMLAVCINARASLVDTLTEGRPFAVNILGEHAEALAARFGGAAPPDRRFETVAWRTAANGAPLLDDAVAAFACRIVSRSPAASHLLVLAQIEDVRLADADRPLLYAHGDYARLSSPIRKPTSLEASPCPQSVSAISV